MTQKFFAHLSVAALVGLVAACGNIAPDTAGRANDGNSRTTTEMIALEGCIQPVAGSSTEAYELADAAQLPAELQPQATQVMDHAPLVDPGGRVRLVGSKNEFKHYAGKRVTVTGEVDVQNLRAGAVAVGTSGQSSTMHGSDDADRNAPLVAVELVKAAAGSCQDHR